MICFTIYRAVKCTGPNQDLVSGFTKWPISKEVGILFSKRKLNKLS